MTMTSALIKTYYAEKTGRDPRSIHVVGVMPCVAKKFEIHRPEHYYAEGIPYTDDVITTRELIWMIKCYGINFRDLPDGDFDAPLGISTGAGDIFGTTGGVLEASLRTASEIITGKALEKLEFTDVRAVEGMREATITIGDLSLNVGVANGLVNAKTLLEKVVRGDKQFHVIEIMACPGGCIGGGGQPYPPRGYTILDPKLLAERARALYSIDEAKTIRQSHKNPAVLALYDEFLGKPGSEKAHDLLHTHYEQRLPKGIK
jgi:iron only hydrogenase large subunit-like protein